VERHLRGRAQQCPQAGGIVDPRQFYQDAGCALLGDDRFAVETATPVWAPAPGQAAVLYDGDLCLGGGRIARAA
jgi:tRNA-specific 2-thiouridylase